MRGEGVCVHLVRLSCIVDSTVLSNVNNTNMDVRVLDKAQSIHEFSSPMPKIPKREFVLEKGIGVTIGFLVPTREKISSVRLLLARERSPVL